MDSQRPTPTSHQSRPDRLIRERYMTPTGPRVCCLNRRFACTAMRCTIKVAGPGLPARPRPMRRCALSVSVAVQQYPAAYLTSSGISLQEHRTDIINLAYNEEAAARAAQAGVGPATTDCARPAAVVPRRPRRAEGYAIGAENPGLRTRVGVQVCAPMACLLSCGSHKSGEARCWLQYFQVISAGHCRAL